MGAFALAAERRWECPNCDHTDVTQEAAPHTRFHNCPRPGRPERPRWCPPARAARSRRSSAAITSAGSIVWSANGVLRITV
jgi:hypothetical protein